MHVKLLFNNIGSCSRYIHAQSPYRENVFVLLRVCAAHSHACLVDSLCSLKASCIPGFGTWQMDHQWPRSSYMYLASMALIACWVVSQPHARTIIFGDWERMIQCQWEKRNAGNETDILYVWGEWEEWGRQSGRCSISSTERVPPSPHTSPSCPHQHRCYVV